MKKQKWLFASIFCVILVLIFLPVVPTQVLVPSDPALRVKVYFSGYGSVTYYLLGFGGTSAAGTYRVTFAN